MRKIIHIDMDCFFAAVEQRDHPEWRGKPLAVGHNGPRSVVSTASYEARKYGVHSAQPVSVALRKCPHLILAPGRFEAYKEASAIIRTIFHEYTDLVEPASLDEAYLDVTEPKQGPHSASLIALEIKQKIFEQTQLTASAGVSYNKFLAKIASDMDKPDGFTLIKPDEAVAFLEDLDIGKFHGVGARTEQRMNALKIYKGRDLKEFSRERLTQIFGKVGNYFYDVVRGVDERPVEPYRERKSVGAEHTYETDLMTFDEVIENMRQVEKTVWRRLDRLNKKGRTMTLKVRYGDFQTVTRSMSRVNPLDSFDVSVQVYHMLKELEDVIEELGVRLLGLSISNFPGEEKIEKYKQLEIPFKWLEDEEDKDMEVASDME